MAFVVKDRVQETSTTTGTGSFALAGAISGYQTFSSAVGNANTTYYAIVGDGQWETGIGTYSSSGNTLSRDTVIESSTGGKVNFNAGTKRVFVTYPATKAVDVENSQTLTNKTLASGTVITGGAIDGTTIGGSTPAAGTFTTLTGNSTSQFGRSSANYFQAIGAATTLTPEISVLGSDTNIPFTIESKGTGAINLSAGSRGINVLNGQTVTAITRTATGSGYTTAPTMTISAPTTAGGVQATATPTFNYQTATIVSGGTGYTAGDVLTVSGGTQTSAATITVATVSGGVITSVTAGPAFGIYTALPSNPVSVTGGTGNSATFNLTWALGSTFTITNAGSGYVEQPTVSFSGGGGSGAAAYATVGSGVVFRSLGATGAQNIDFAGPGYITASIPTLRLRDVGGADSYIQIQNAGFGTPTLVAQGATNSSIFVGCNGTGNVNFTTNGTSGITQLRVSHTASAVNYVQVTGAATTGRPTISAQGSDTNIDLNLTAKGTGTIRNNVGNSITWLMSSASTTVARFMAGGQSILEARFSVPSFMRFLTGSAADFSLEGAEQFRVANTASAVNYIQATGAATTAAPAISAQGSDTNIDLTLTPKGTGRIKFGTHTATADTAISGYIEILDSGGTVRKLAVIT